MICILNTCRNIVLNCELIRYNRADDQFDDLSTLPHTIMRLINSMRSLYTSPPYVDFIFIYFPLFCCLTTLPVSKPYSDTMNNECGAVSGMRIGTGKSKYSDPLLLAVSHFAV
jgi:hypothetical protein